MSLFICTPMYGGMCTSAYFTSALALKESFDQVGLDHNWLVTSNESLIPRARNTSVMRFLEHDYQKLFFIDADIEFSAEDVAKLWNMDVPIACAAYPMKRPDSPLSAWIKGELVSDLDRFQEPIEVDFAGTGFLMIDRQVFLDFKEKWPDWEHMEGQDLKPCFTWFNTTVEEDGAGNKVFLSEDYFFCKRARELGYKIMLEPTIRLTHWGTWGYC